MEILNIAILLKLLYELLTFIVLTILKRNRKKLSIKKNWLIYLSFSIKNFCLFTLELICEHELQV